MQNPSRPAHAPLLAAIAALGLAAAGSARAADVFWNPPVAGSGGTVSWSNALNWTGGVVPADNLSTDVAVFAGSAYNFQPTLDAFTVRSVNGLRFGGAGTVAATLAAGTGTRTTSGITAANASTVVLADAAGVAVGQQLTGAGYSPGTFVTAVDAGSGTITLSRPRANNTLANGATLTFASSLRLGASGIALSASTPNVTNTITAPLVLGANQTWNNQAASRTLAVQGSIYLDNHTLTLNGVANSLIALNGSSTTQSIGGSGRIVVNTAGTVDFGSGSGSRMQNTFTGGVTLDAGTLRLQGGHSGGSDAGGNLGTGNLTINGGTLTGGGNIAGHALTISGQTWNADWIYGGGKSIDMGVGAITLGTAAGASRTLTANSGANILTLGGGISNGTTANTFIKAGTGSILLNGVNTYTGNTVVDDGTLTLGAPGAFTLYIGANGVNNALTGDGILALDGRLIFDLAGADATHGNSWTIIASSLLPTTSFGATFSVEGFTQSGGVWANGNYSFSELTGQLTYSAVPEPSSFALLGGLGALGLVAVRRRRRA